RDTPHACRVVPVDGRMVAHPPEVRVRVVGVEPPVQQANGGVVRVTGHVQTVRRWVVDRARACQPNAGATVDEGPDLPDQAEARACPTGAPGPCTSSSETVQYFS